MKREDQHRLIENIDGFICAELLDKEKNQELYDAVSECMVHGPCGLERINSPYMDDNKKCSKRYPKDYIDHTKIDNNGYPVYRRRNTGITVDKGGIILDNRYVNLLLK